MFDYQAGEKYRLTLIMVGVAGLIAGMFFCMLLMPTAEPTRGRKQVAMTRAMTDPDVTGGGSRGAGGRAQGIAAAVVGNQMPVDMVDRSQAQMFMQNWLARVWDLNASTATASQDEAMKWMTPECANAYRQNIWTPELSKQVQESGLQSSFQPKDINVSDNLADGSVVVKVTGTQNLIAAAGQKSKDVHLEYMLKQTADGIRVAGISEGTH